MHDPFVRGLSAHKIEYEHNRGAIIRLTQGLYAWHEPTPEQLATELLTRLPKAALTGESLAQLLLKEPLTFPLHIVSPHARASSRYVDFKRGKEKRHFGAKGLRIHQPLLAASFLSDERAIQLFESHYANVQGKDQLELELSIVKRLPSRTRKLLNLASTGSDSPPERTLVKALRSRGVRVETNVQIGAYRWDVVLPALKMAIEIDGYESHRTRDQLIRDSWKGNEATLEGWTVFRYSGSCINHHLPEVLDQLLNGARPPGVWTWHRAYTVHDPWGLFENPET